VKLANPRPDDPAIRAILDPRKLLRWVFIGRLSVASAIFIAAVFQWKTADAAATLIASLVFAVATVVTGLSAVSTEIYKRRPGPTFLYLQAIFDLLVVTAVVHVMSMTGGGSSQFSALYILVIAFASLLVPIGGGLLIAALGIVLYFADVVWFLRSTLEPGLWVQLAIFAIVAWVSAHLSEQLRERGEGKDQLAAELEQMRLQAEDILRNIRSGVITVDVSGRLLYANPMAEQLLGVGLVEHFGHPVLEIVATVAPDLAQAIDRCARDRVRTTRGEVIVSSIGKRFAVGVTTTYTDPEDARHPLTATAIFQDISDQKRIDALRLRAERLEGIAELSASLAHEIKNPLASIRSAVEQLSNMPRVSADEKTLSALVLRESDRLSRLLSEFLDFARVRVVRTTAVDLAAVARGAAGLAGAHPDRPEGVRITCIAPEGESMHVDGDEDLLHRAVFNLALNAVQAAPAQSEVSIELSGGSFDPLPVGVSFDGGAIALRVSDSGPGIPAEIRDRLFDPFFTTKPNGSGLGLAVVHRAIEAHRGVVFVDTSARGTRFTVVLPKSQAAVPAGSVL
jgi:two-component system sensor histidine kinase PilS (NtrC family)